MKEIQNTEELADVLDQMISNQKEKKAKTYVAQYKGKNLIMRSGKSSWKQIGHAKSAILCHFNSLESNYVFEQIDPYIDSQGVMRNNYNYNKENQERREKEFREKLFSLIEIVELTQ
jgi:hypothetical protein